jgi:hypothetical protein
MHNACVISDAPVATAVTESVTRRRGKAKLPELLYKKRGMQIWRLDVCV